MGIVDEPVGAVPLEDDRAFAVVGSGDAFVGPVDEVGRVGEVDLGAVGLVLVPEAPVAGGQAEDAGVDCAFGLEVGVGEGVQWRRSLLVRCWMWRGCFQSVKVPGTTVRNMW